MSATRELAKYALSLTFDDLPADVIHQTKRILLDTLGCAIGGYASETSTIIQQVIKELNGCEEATVIGSGIRTSCLNAALANGAMTRYLDYNDTAFIKEGERYRAGYHPSEVIPPILAVGEKQHISGKETVTAIVTAYDLSLRFLNANTGEEMEKRGWNGDIRGAYVIPAITGRLLGLTETQVENAIGISGSRQAVFGILDAPGEEYTMTKNIRFPSMAYGGILSALLAQKGFTGPTSIIEGPAGFTELVMKGEYDVSKLSDPKLQFTIRDTAIKSVIADFSTHGHLNATLALVREHDIKPEDIDRIRVRASTRCVWHTGNPVKKYPRNKESADHSSYYLTAIAIIDRQLGPGQFSAEKYADPKVHELIEKITLEVDTELDRERNAGIVEIITKQGARYSCRVDYPKGHPLNPMTDEEVIGKFRPMATKHMSASQVDQLIDTIFKLDELDDIGELLSLMVFAYK